MIHFTLIARTLDGLPLASSVDDATTEDAYSEYRRLAKQLIKTAFTSFSNRQLPVQGSITTDNNLVFQFVPSASVGSWILQYSYTTEAGVGIVALCESSYARLLAFSFLQDLQKSFLSSENNLDIQNASRPYAFIRFESEITKLTRRYMNTRSLRTQDNLAELSSRLQSIPTMTLQDALPDYKPSGRGSSRVVTDLASNKNSGGGSQSYGPNSLWTRLKHNAHTLWYRGGQLELIMVLCWSYILFWNLIFDLWFGLGWHIPTPEAADRISPVSAMHRMNQKDPSTPTPPETEPLSASPLLSITVGFYGLAGLWLMFQLYHVLLSAHGHSSPVFITPMALFGHLSFTGFFLLQTLVTNLPGHVNYFVIRQGWKETDALSAGQWIWSALVYLIYTVIGMIWWVRGDGFAFAVEESNERKVV